jgi:hypothetical protein
VLCHVAAAYNSDTRAHLPPIEQLFNLQEQDSKKQNSGGGIGGFFGKVCVYAIRYSLHVLLTSM